MTRQVARERISTSQMVRVRGNGDSQECDAGIRRRGDFVGYEGGERRTEVEKDDKMKR